MRQAIAWAEVGAGVAERRGEARVHARQILAEDLADRRR